MDLRVRVLAALDQGLSCRAAAVRFGIAPSTAIRWFGQRRLTGNVAPKPHGGDMRSRRVEERAAEILSIWEARKDITLEERTGLAEIGLTVSVAGLHRFFVRRGMTRKKSSPELVEGTAHAIEQDRPDVLKQRHDWFDGQIDLDPERLVFINETWTATNMTPPGGLARCQAIRAALIEPQNPVTNDLQRHPGNFRCLATASAVQDQCHRQ